jgi:hypothetical protein
METNDILILAVVVIASVTIGVTLSYFIITGINFPREITIVESIPSCNPATGQYTPGACGVYTNLTFTQCKPMNFTGEANGT